MSATTAYLGLGSNLGDRLAHLQAAVDGLHALRGLDVTAVSPVYETEAHTLDPSETQPPFLNAVVAVRTTCAPEALLHAGHAMERTAGRDRTARRWAPRPLDVDVLAYGERVHATDTLTLPHPRLAERRFVLRPWADLAPNLRLPPPFNATVKTLLAQCPDGASLRQAPATLSLPPSASSRHPPA